MGHGQVRIDGERFLIVGDSFTGTIQCLQYGSQVVLGCGVVRAVVDGAAIARQGFIQLSQRFQHVS